QRAGGEDADAHRRGAGHRGQHQVHPEREGHQQAPRRLAHPRQGVLEVPVPDLPVHRRRPGVDQAERGEHGAGEGHRHGVHERVEGVPPRQRRRARDDDDVATAIVIITIASRVATGRRESRRERDSGDEDGADAQDLRRLRHFLGLGDLV
ncbi:Os11g0198951, partial [Oryza sativa Japonica Group]